MMRASPSTIRERQQCSWPTPVVRCARRRGGFTLVEVVLASGLTVFLAVVLSTTWVALSRPAAELIAWSHLFQEVDLAVASLSRDLGGGLPDNQLGGKRQGRLLQCKRVSDVGGDRLWLCYDGGTNPDGLATWNEPTDDTTVEYYVDPTTDSESGRYQRLIRVKHEGGVASSFTVARYVTSLNITDAPNNALRIELNFQFNGYTPKGSSTPLSRQCVLIVKKTP